MKKIRKIFIALMACLMWSVAMVGTTACEASEKFPANNSSDISNNSKEENAQSSMESTEIAESAQFSTESIESAESTQSSTETDESQESVESSEEDSFESSDNDVGYDNGNGIYELGEKMADFSVITSTGEVFQLFEVLKEKDMVVLNFWATWCGPCKMEFPYLNEAYQAYQDRVAVLGISITDDMEALSVFKEDTGYLFDLAPDTNGLQNDFNVAAIPYTIIIDRFGVITYTHIGYIISTKEFTDLFDIFCGEDYEQSIIIDETLEPTP